MHRACVIFVAFAAGTAHAGGLVVTHGSPRAIGRAGTGTVGDDGAGALLVNPAALARRDTWRGQLGIAFTDDEIAWTHARSSPVARNQAASAIAPNGAVIGELGGFVIGAGAMTAAVSERSLRPPSAFPASEIAKDTDFEFRYAGIAGSVRRETVALGIARRLGDSVALGASVGLSRVSVRENRRIWAASGAASIPGDPRFDIELEMAAADPVVPSVVGGVLFAPLEQPIELAASVAWSARANLDASVGRFIHDDGIPSTRGNARATLRLAQPLAVRGGARYLGERFVVELGGDLWIAPASARDVSWDVTGLDVIERLGSAPQPITRVPSRISQRTHAAIRGAADVELIGGFLWATAGYAYSVGGVAASRQSPTFGDLGGHTLAIGLEATAGGVTVTAGWSRTWALAQHADSELGLDNPYPRGVSAPVPVGSYDGSVDQIGLLVDAELSATD